MKILQTLFIALLSLSLSAQDYSKSLITTTGEAIVYAAPDEIRMTLGITTTAVEISQAKADNNRISSKTIKYLKEQGISPQHIQTQYLRVSKLGRGQGTYVGKELHFFSAGQTLNICIKDLKKYTKIVDGLLEIGITSVGNPQFRNTNIRKYKDEARVKAIKAAKEKAALLVGALGQSIGVAYQIKEIEGQSRNNQGAYATGGNSASVEREGELSFAPGQLEVIARVEVAFVLRNE